MKIGTRDVGTLIVLVIIAFIANTFYLTPAANIARGSGTVLSDNWWEALNWIEQNTPECAVVATYWDPGHFITAIAKRPIIFGGASQNAPFELDIPRDLTEQEIKEAAVTEKYTVQKKVINGTTHTIISRARIQDIGTTLFTANETLAYNILKQYNKPGCSEMYFVASSDLIGKSHWWTYFATWNPVDKGTPYNYATVYLTNRRPVLQQDAIAYTYAIDNSRAFVVFDANGTLQPFLQEGGNFAAVEKIFYVNDAGQGIISTNPDAELKGLVWLEQTRQVMVYVPTELENALFTRMFFFNGSGLEHFEFVNSWGGEFKLFRLKIE